MMREVMCSTLLPIGFHAANDNTVIIISHQAAVVSHGWAKASACRLQVGLSYAVLCQIVSVQYLSRSSLNRLAGLPFRLFLCYSLQVVDFLCPRLFNCTHVADYIYYLQSKIHSNINTRTLSFVPAQSTVCICTHMHT